MLVQHGANPNAKDANLNSPLHLAVFNNESGSVQALLQLGANPLTTDANGRKPIDLAMKLGYDHLAYYVQPLVDEQFKHPIQMAHGKSDMILRLSIGAVGLSLTAGVLVLINREKHLIESVETANAKPIRKVIAPEPILPKPIDPAEILPKKNQSTQFIAKITSSIKREVEMLKKQEAERQEVAHKKQDALNQALLSAVTSVNLGEVERLLENGANPNAKSADGSPALKLALQKNEAMIAQVLVEKGADPNIFINIVDQEYSLQLTPLHYASLKGNASLAEVLLKHKANVDIRDRWGSTPLHMAVLDNHPRIIELLCRNHANTNLKDRDGETPLHLLAQNYRSQSLEEISEILFKYGAKPNERDNEDLTPLLLALGARYFLRQNVDPAIVKILLDHGADPYLKTKSGEVALELARSRSRYGTEDDTKRWKVVCEILERNEKASH